MFHRNCLPHPEKEGEKHTTKATSLSKNEVHSGINWPKQTLRKLDLRTRSGNKDRVSSWRDQRACPPVLPPLSHWATSSQTSPENYKQDSNVFSFMLLQPQKFSTITTKLCFLSPSPMSKVFVWTHTAASVRRYVTAIYCFREPQTHWAVLHPEQN